jgi:hypothetical protein
MVFTMVACFCLFMVPRKHLPLQRVSLLLSSVCILPVLPLGADMGTVLVAEPAPAKCGCDPRAVVRTGVSQFTTCKLERNPYGLTALVAHSSHNHACDPLEELVDRPKCHAEAATQHRCKYAGDANGHRSCAGIKTAWEGSGPPENSNYFVEIGGANGIDGSGAGTTCCGGMTQVTCADLPTIA